MSFESTNSSSSSSSSITNHDSIRWPTGYEQSDLYKQYPDLYEAIFVNKRNIFLSGPGGTGKSYSIGMIKKESDRLQIACALTATTGPAAHGLGPGSSTIHRWSGIRLGDKPIETIIGWIRSRPENKDRWKNTQILVIDELSMLDDITFQLISNVGKRIRGSSGTGKRLMKLTNLPPFGGIQLIATADFLQLPPVKGNFAFESPLWDEMKFYNYRMTHPFRHSDPEHAAMMNRIRVGEMTPDDEKKLYERVVAYEEYRKKETSGKLEDDIKPTRIYSLKKDVEAINLEELEKLEGDSFLYESQDVITIKPAKDGTPLIRAEDINTREYVEYMNGLASSEVLIKVGSQVMLTKNLSVESGLVNGSRGIVEECRDELILVRFRSGERIGIEPFGYEYEDENVKCVRGQFPLILAWAITIHKSQGATLDAAVADCGTSVFAPGMGYVVLSRVRSLKGLLLTNFIPKLIRPHPKALEFDKKMIPLSVMARPILDNTNETNDPGSTSS